MKKPSVRFLAAAAAVLLVFLIFFGLGRDKNKPPITVSLLHRESMGQEGSAPETGKLNINTATAEQLQCLTGIGPVLAQRILDYRRENGEFQTVSELTMVKGIGLSLLDQIMDDITVGR